MTTPTPPASAGDSAPQAPRNVNSIDSSRLVFVCGMHRSGTTLLAQLLGDSAGFSALSGTGVRMDEGQFLQGVYPRGEDMGGVTKWAFNSRSHLTESDAREGHAQSLLSSWTPYWDLDATYLVEKTPLNLTKTRFLQELFPEARFVIITRHPVTQAMAVQKWSPTLLGKLGVGFPRLVNHWVHAHTVYSDDSAHLRRKIVIRYERLIMDPQREIDRLEEFFETKLTLANEVAAQIARLTTAARSYGRQRSDLARSLAEASSAMLRPLHRRRLRKYSSTVASLGYCLDDLEQPLEEPSQ